LKGAKVEVFKERTIKEGTWKKDDANNMWEKMQPAFGRRSQRCVE
jgi:hypothetical protein